MTAPQPNLSALTEIIKKYQYNFDIEEIDGLLCGMVCANNNQVEEHDWQKICFETPIDEPLLHQHFNHRKSIFSEQDDAFSFTPLLADINEQPIAHCVQSLKKWCIGFMSGIGLNMGQKAFEDNKNSMEILQDLHKITQLDETNIPDDEQSQEDYLEIFEFLRVAVWTIDQEMRIQVFENKNKKTNVHTPASK